MSFLLNPYIFGGGGGGGTPPAPIYPNYVQHTARQNGGSLTWGTAPTVGNTLLGVFGSWEGSVYGNVPTGFKIHDVRTGPNGRTLILAGKIAESGDASGYSLPNNDSYAVIYEYEQVIAPEFLASGTVTSAALTAAMGYSLAVDEEAIFGGSYWGAGPGAETGFTLDAWYNAAYGGGAGRLANGFDGTLSDGTSSGVWAYYFLNALRTFTDAEGGALFYSGADREFTVPAGVSQIDFEAWGAGAGGGRYSSGFFGGGGGYAAGSIAVTPGDTVKLQVGGGGKYTVGARGLGGWPDGGDGSFGDTHGSGGGGSSRIWLNGTLVAVGGGGGGGSGYQGNAGGGGGSSGQASAFGSGGSGGTQSAGGVDRNDTGNTAKQGKSLIAVGPTGKTGGDASANTSTSTGDDGGAGGGGYWGGGGGGGDGQAGGGGSGYVSGSVTGSVLTAANYQTPVNPNGTRFPGCALGEDGSSATTKTGGHGQINITFS